MCVQNCFSKWKKHPLFLIITFVSLISLACSEGSTGSDAETQNTSLESGSVIFVVSWQKNGTAKNEAYQPLSPSDDVCVDYNIDTIKCNVYDDSNAIVTTRSWPCWWRSATISKVPSGSGLWLSLEGIVSETVQWEGQSSPFNLTPNTTANAGKIAVFYTGNDTQPPEIVNTMPANGAEYVSLDARIAITFSETVVSASAAPAFSIASVDSSAVSGSASYDSDTRTLTFTPDSHLSESSIYTATVAMTVEDLAGNQMSNDFIWEFTTTSREAPSVTTHPATTITQDTATLNGSVNPNGLATTYFFEYGPDQNYGSTTTNQTAGAGQSPVSVVAEMTGLNPGTQYHYRIVASNNIGTTLGSVIQFTTGTGGEVPSITTQPATELTHNRARLNALVNPKGLATTYFFEYGPDATYGSATVTQDAGSGDSPISISADISNLDSNTTYHFRISATNAIGTSNGSDGIFTTNKVWANTYGPIDTSSRGEVKRTSDGGYIISGSNRLISENDADIWLLKLNADGNVIWEKKYSALGWDNISSVQEGFEGGYLFTGYTSPDLKDGQSLIVKLDVNGLPQWSRMFDQANINSFNSIEPTSDGGFILVGKTTSSLSGNDIWVAKITQTGLISWQKSYGGDSDESSSAIQQTSDDGFIVAGSTESFGSGAFDCFVMKLNADGTVVWQSTYGGADSDSCGDIQQTADGGYIVAGSTMSFGEGQNDFWVLKLDFQGNVIWQKAYGGDEDEVRSSFDLAPNGGYVMIGHSESFSQNRDYWILAIDAYGDILWQKGYGGPGRDYASSIQQTRDGGLIAAGVSNSYRNNGEDYTGDILLFKMGQDGTLGCGLDYDTSASVSDSNVNAAETHVTVRNTPVITTATSITVSDTAAMVQTLCE